jgi:hypothetical protein
MKPTLDVNKLVENGEHGLQELYNNTYFGRLVLMGASLDHKYVLIITAISGRSVGSQNRRYVHDQKIGRIWTEVVDENLETGDPELTLYDAQLDRKRVVFTASNGRQTEDCLMYSNDLLGAFLQKWDHEPDHPNYTSRISARCQLNGGEPPLFDFATHRRCAIETTCIESTKPQFILPGFGLYLSTYAGNGNPPQEFFGGPRLITLPENPLLELKEGLSTNNDFLVALAVKKVSLSDGTSTIEIWNRHG